MTTSPSALYAERLRAPISWWLGVGVFAATCGWIVLVVGDVAVAVAVTAVAAALSGLGVHRFGSLELAVSDELQAGRARLDAPSVGEITVLDHAGYRHTMGAGADVRALLVTRPWIDRGVRVAIDDAADPTPYWLLGSREPARLAAALERMRQTGTTAGPAPDRPDDSV